MTKHQIELEIEELQIESRALSSMAFAIQEAFDHGDGDADTYTPGFWLLANLIQQHASKIEDINNAINRNRATVA